MKSIIQDEQVCFLCGSTDRLQEHHIFGGNPNRKNSEEDGLKVYLCKFHHEGDERGNRNAVHFNDELMQMLHEIGQAYYERTHTRDEFRKRYGRSWL